VKNNNKPLHTINESKQTLQSLLLKNKFLNISQENLLVNPKLHPSTPNGKLESNIQVCYQPDNQPDNQQLITFNNKAKSA